MTKPKIVVLASGSGSLFAAIAQSIKNGELDAQIVGLITDQPCGAEAIANDFGIAISRIELGSSRVDWNTELSQALSELDPALVVSAGFMKIIGEPTISKFANRIVNTHPALLPNFPGAHAVRDALAAGATHTGCTVHFVDAGMDTGKVIAQRELEILPNETESDLHERIKVLERILIVETIAELLTKEAQ